MNTRKSKTLAALSRGGGAVAMLLSACGGSSSSSQSGSTNYVEPSSGIPSSYKGDLPTPSSTKGYYNVQPRSNVKDGTLNLAISEIGPTGTT